MMVCMMIVCLLPIAVRAGSARQRNPVCVCVVVIRYNGSSVHGWVQHSASVRPDKDNVQVLNLVLIPIAAEALKG